MNRGDILAKLQSTSATETHTLSITDGTASDLQQHYDSDRECDDNGKNKATAQLFDMQAITKNKRKNFKPRNAQTTATIDGDHHPQQQQQQHQPHSLTEQFLLNLIMQNKMKQLQQELHQGQSKRWLDDSRTLSIENLSSSSEHGEHRTMLNTDDSNYITHSKSPPSSPLTNGHLTATGGKSQLLFYLLYSFCWKTKAFQKVNLMFSSFFIFATRRFFLSQERIGMINE